MSHVGTAGLAMGRTLGSTHVGVQGGGWRPSRFLAGLTAGGLLLAIALVALTPASSVSQAPSDRIANAYGKLPLSFVPNKGQTDPSVRYYAQGAGFGFYFTDSKAVLSLQRGGRGQALQLRFLGASGSAELVPGREARGKVNYMQGDDSHKWQTGLPTYGQLAYQGLWPGVDMRFRGAGGKLKYEFALAPGASPQSIRLAYAGAAGLSLSQGGSLSIRTPLGTLRDSKPRAWQRIGGRKVPVQSRYSLNKGGGAHSYGFELGTYDRSHPVLIDPGLDYSTYLGGTGTDLGNQIAVDGAGSAYVTGRTTSAGFPTTPGAFDTTPNGGEDAFVTKLDPSGSALVYSTFLGGTGVEEANGIEVDGAGSAYVTGETTSSDFPTTAGAFDTTSNGSDAFVTKLDASGSALAYSTYLGGTGGGDIARAIALDGAGSAYVTGYTNSGSFPTTPGAFDTTYSAGGSFDAFVTKLDPSGSALAYSTFLGGGGGTDTGNAIVVDGAGSAHVAGGTSSPSFPTTPGAYDTTHNGTDDGFITKLSASGSTLDYSTYLGGASFDGAGGIALDGAGSAYLTGYTSSTDFPTTPGAFDTSYNGSSDAFVAKLDAAGAALAYSTYLGGTDPGGAYDSGTGIAVDAGSAVVTGRTDSVLFPTTTGAYDTSYNGVGDAFVTKIDAPGSTLAYSTYLGGTGTETGSGIALDGAGKPYVTGYTTSSDYPTTAGAFDTTSNGSYDAFVTKLDTGSYAHPASASPISVSLVPVFGQCGTPANPGNGEHAPPLAVAACLPPVPTSTLRMGPAGSGSMRFEAAPGDVAITGSATDIQDAAAAPYTGTLGAIVRMRFTDANNCIPSGCSGPYEEAGTTTDVDFGPIAFPCSAGVCSVTTTANAFMPGAVVAGKATNVQLFRVRVLDGIPSGTLFLQQGIFIP